MIIFGVLSMIAGVYLSLNGREYIGIPLFIFGVTILCLT